MEGPSAPASSFHACCCPAAARSGTIGATLASPDLFAAQAIDDWRDEHVLLAAGALNGLAIALDERVGRELAQADTAPLVLSGGLVVTGAALLAGWGVARLRPRIEARLRERVREQIVATLLDGTPRHPSVLTRITDRLAVAAEEAKGS